MSEPFNPYAAWLGWSGESKTPNYFQLLGIEFGEEDPKVIVAAADRAASRVRRFRPGENAVAWASLLDELAAAKQCLIDPSSRREYLQTLRSGAAPTGKGGGPSSPAAAAHPGLYPPGFPGAAPSQPQASAESTLQPVRSATPLPGSEIPGTLPPAPSFDPMAAMPVAIPGFPQTPGPSPYVPSPFAPFQPFDPAAAMQPLVLPAAHPFSADPMAPNPMLAQPLAPNPMAPNPMAPNPMAPASVPMAIPLGGSMTPYSASASPAAPAAPASLPGSRASSAPSFRPGPEEETNRASVAVYSARRAKSRVVGPILVGAVMGLVLLGIAAAAYHYFGDGRDQDQVAAVPEQPGPVPPNSEQPASVPPASSPQPLTFGTKQPAVPRPPTPSATPKPSTETKPEPSSEPEMESMPKSTTEPKPESMPEPTPKPDSKPEPTPKPEPKSEPKPEPKPATAEVLEGIPQPTAADLTKLGKALQKARDAIGEHDFERAAAFLDVASEMPRLPEHQAMIDRLKVFGDSVQQYRAAIQASIDKLQSGSSFEVGSANVGVVETGPDKVIFRVAGQNRTYTIREMPVGLAAALAAQTIAPEDPNTLTLKGAFVLASPKAKEEDLTKAREFLEKGAASVDAAKDLLLLMKDNYALKAP